MLRQFLGKSAKQLAGIFDVTVAPGGTEAWRNAFRIIQGREIWTIYGAWIERRRPNLGPGIKERLAFAATVTQYQERDARAVMEAARKRIRVLAPPGTVICLPTVPTIAPRNDASPATLDDFRVRVMALTCIAGLSGLPQVTIPAASVNGCPAGLSFIGWENGDETLLDLAAALAPYCGA